MKPDSGQYNKDTGEYTKLVTDLYEKYDDLVLPPEYAEFAESNLLQFLIRLSRYKFVSKMIKPADRLLEIGCGSGLGSIFMGQHCESVKGIDVKQHQIEEALSINKRDNVEFEKADFFNLPQGTKYDVIVSLDVIEHLDEPSGTRLLKRTREHLHDEGMLIIGTPSKYSYEYQNRFSKASHIKLYDQKELSGIIDKYYNRSIAFSMNDEVVHTGFHKLAWYYFVLAFCPKREEVIND